MYPDLKQKHEWFEEFRTTQKYKSVVEYFSNYSDDYFKATKNLSVVVNLDNKFLGTKKRFSPTPREHNLIYKLLVLDSFRILDYIEEYGPQPIYDIGCGVNIFANFYNVIGMEITLPSEFVPVTHYTHIEPFDKKFAKQHVNSFPSAIAINSLHFIPIYDLADRIYDFASVIKEGGLGYITFNLEMVMENTSTKYLMENQLYYPANAKKYLDGIVESLNLNIISYENTIQDRLYSMYDSVDGTIRILFSKQ